MDDPEGSQPESGDALFSAQNGFFQQNFQQFPEIHSQSGGLLGHQTCRSHSGQRIDFQHMNRAVIPQDKIRPAVSPQSKAAVRFQGGFPHLFQKSFRQRRRADFTFTGIRIFGVVIKELMFRHDQHRGQSFGASAAFQYAACRLSSRISGSISTV